MEWLVPRSVSSKGRCLSLPHGTQLACRSVSTPRASLHTIFLLTGSQLSRRIRQRGQLRLMVKAPFCKHSATPPTSWRQGILFKAYPRFLSCSSVMTSGVLGSGDTQAPLSYLPDLDGNNAPKRRDSLLGLGLACDILHILLASK